MCVSVCCVVYGRSCVVLGGKFEALKEHWNDWSFVYILLTFEVCEMNAFVTMGCREWIFFCVESRVVAGS